VEAIGVDQWTGPMEFVSKSIPGPKKA